LRATVSTWLFCIRFWVSFFFSPNPKTNTPSPKTRTPSLFKDPQMIDCLLVARERDSPNHLADSNNTQQQQQQHNRPLQIHTRPPSYHQPPPRRIKKPPPKSRHGELQSPLLSPHYLQTSQTQ
jgi:hypothetical protein